MKADSSHSNKFQKFAYHLLDNSGVVLIQYIGSELEAEDHPHGNSVNDSKPYIRTCPSVIQQIKDSDPSEFPSAFYKKSLSAASGPAASNASLHGWGYHLQCLQRHGIDSDDISDKLLGPCCLVIIN